MRASGFTLVEAQISLLLTLVLAAGIWGLFLAGARALERVEAFQRNLSPYLLASRIAEDYSRAVLYQGKSYYRAVGVGVGQSGRCRRVYGKKTPTVFHRGRLITSCPEGEVVLFLRKKRVFLQGDGIFLEVGGRVQPMASGIRSFRLTRQGKFVRVSVNGREVVRRLK